MTEQLLTFAKFVDQFRAWVEWYNVQRPHGALGGLTPIQALACDPVAIVRYEDLDALRHALLRPLELRKVDKNGISFRGRYYVDAALDAFVGGKVQIGYIEERPETIEVFVGGHWKATATWDRLLTPEDRGRMQHSRQKSYQTVSNVNLAAKLVRAEQERMLSPDAPDEEPETAVAGDDAATALSLLVPKKDAA